MMHPLMNEAGALQPRLVQWRRALHQIPELRLQLPQTLAFVRDKLDAMGVRYKVYEPISAIVASIGSGQRCYLLRSDMDGLPMVEQSGLPFAAVNGNMHSCGHDLHTTILLGAAQLLKAHEPELQGTVKLFFQSGEEQVEGALAAIEAGLLDEAPQPEAAFAIHVAAATPAGLLGTAKQPMSSVYNFCITLTGVGGHGSTPQNCIDPINAGVQVYLALQSLIAREVASSDEAVLTIGKFQAGTQSNIIPDSCLLAGTIRSYEPRVREQMVRRFHEIVPAVAAAYRCGCRIEIPGDCPSVVNDDRVMASAARSIKELLGVEIERNMRGTGSEDFAWLCQRIPGAYFILGAGVEDASRWRGQHNPEVVFNEAVLATGAAVYAKVAMDWLESK